MLNAFPPALCGWLRQGAWWCWSSTAESISSLLMVGKCREKWWNGLGGELGAGRWGLEATRGSFQKEARERLRPAISLSVERKEFSWLSLNSKCLHCQWGLLVKEEVFKLVSVLEEYWEIDLGILLYLSNLILKVSFIGLAANCFKQSLKNVRA